MLCPRCSSENRDGVRFCSGCGSPLAQESDPVYTAPTAAALPHRQLGIAIISAALFLYSAGSTLGFAFVFLQSSYALSSAGVQLAGYLLVAILGGWGVFSSLRDRKAALTVLAGGMLFRSAVAFLGMLTMRAPVMLMLGWLLVGVVSAGILWSVWKTAPIAAGDADRLSVALTVLLAAEVAALIFGIVLSPSMVRAPYLIVSAAGIGALVWLRTKLPGAIGPAAAGPAGWSATPAAGRVDRRMRLVLFLAVFIVIAVILRVILGQAFR